MVDQQSIFLILILILILVLVVLVLGDRNALVTFRSHRIRNRKKLKRLFI